MPGLEPDPPPAHKRPIGPRARPRPVGEPGEAPPHPAPAACEAPAPRATRVLLGVATRTCVSGRVWATAPTAPITLVQTGPRRAGGTPLGARRRPEETLLKGACRDGGRPPAGGRGHNTWPRCATRNAGPYSSSLSDPCKAHQVLASALAPAAPSPRALSSPLAALLSSATRGSHWPPIRASPGGASCRRSDWSPARFRASPQRCPLQTFEPLRVRTHSSLYRCHQRRHHLATFPHL